VVNDAPYPIPVNKNASYIAILGAIGGTVFDYFIDCGVKRVVLYGKPENVVPLYEQAFWLNVDVTNLSDTSEHVCKVYFGDKASIEQIHISQALPPSDIPVVLCDSPQVKIGNSFTTQDLFVYSLSQRVLFKKVFDYQRNISPEMKVVFLSLPSLWSVRNRSDYENDLTKHLYRNLRSIYLELGYDQEYCDDVVNRVHQVYERDGVQFLSDFSSTYDNCVGGYRVSTDLPDKADRTMFFFGSSLCYGKNTDDEHTIPSVIQRQMTEHHNCKPSYRVLNCGNGGHPNFAKMWKSFEYHHPGNGDVVVFVGWFSTLLYSAYRDAALWIRPQTDDRLFDRPHDLGDYVFSDTLHFTPIGYETIGKYAADKLLAGDFLTDVPSADGSSTNELPALSTDPIAKSELADYIQSIRLLAPRIGSIVMNCNPFTLGHQYLVEESARKVSQLIIFVVEEDKSVFPFADRIELVRQGTAHIPNVTIVPSGGFIISQTTFGSYFEKDSIQDVVIDPTNDVEIFGRYIAPALGITIRFAGEEPLDNVTRQYNETMERILPKYNVEFEVIPRKESGDAVISASRVRKLLDSHDFDGIAKLVPQTTLNYLIDKFGNGI